LKNKYLIGTILISMIAACSPPAGEENANSGENNSTTGGDNNATSGNNTTTMTPDVMLDEDGLPVQECEPRLNFCSSADYKKVYRCGSDGVPSRVVEECDEDEVCGVEAGASICIKGSVTEAGECKPADPVSVCVQDIVNPDGTNFPEGIETRLSCAETEITICDPGLFCVADDQDDELSEVSCASSVLDPNARFYNQSCQLLQHLRYKTRLEGDCRCGPNQTPRDGVDFCTVLSTGVSQYRGAPEDKLEGDARNTFGSGPSMIGVFNVQYSGGFIAEDEDNKLIVATLWDAAAQPKGLIMRIDLETGDREVVSGMYPTDTGLEVVGEGPDFHHVIDVRLGPDGKYYALSDAQQPGSAAIFRVDPETGKRDIVWSAAPPGSTYEEALDLGFGHCIGGDGSSTVQYGQNAFLVDDDGSFYLGYANVQRDGRGIVKISPSGDTCEFLTATGVREDGFGRGNGDEMRGMVQGFTKHEGKLWAFTTQPKVLWSIDMETGDRTVEFSSSVAGILGERWAFYDEKREVMWATGLMNSVTITALDLKTDKVIDIFSSCTDDIDWLPLCVTGPAKVISQNYGGAWVHPVTGNLFYVQAADSIVEVELDTGNSVIRSR